MLRIAALVAPFLVNDLFIVLFYDLPLAWFYISDVLLSVLVPVSLLVFLGYRRILTPRGMLKLSPDPTDLRSPTQRRVVSAFIGFILGAFLLLIFTAFIDPLIYSFWPNSYLFPHRFSDSEPFRSLGIAYITLRSSVLEEIVFRGVIASTLADRFDNPALVVVLTSVLFGPIHWYQGTAGVVASIVWSIPVTLLFLKQRNLAGVISLHLTYNTLFLAWRAA